jgi:putative oxidoreductase
MSAITRMHLDHSSSLRQPLWLTILRIALGGMLFIKGIMFIRDTSQLEAILAANRLIKNYTPLAAEAIAWIHLLGGLFILTGFLTRICCVLNIPILLGAVFFVNIPNLAHNGPLELIFSIAILIMLVLFFIEGSGRLSADEYFRRYYKEVN